MTAVRLLAMQSVNDVARVSDPPGQRKPATILPSRGWKHRATADHW